MGGEPLFAPRDKRSSDAAPTIFLPDKRVIDNARHFVKDTEIATDDGVQTRKLFLMDSASN